VGKFDKKPSAEELALARDRPAGIQNDPRGTGLQARTMEGAEVMATTHRPTPPLHFDGKPVDQFTTDLRESGEHLPMENIEDTPRTPSGAEAQLEQLFGQAQEQLLFEQAPPEANKPSEAGASNVALSESIILRDTSSYDVRKEANMASGTVMDELYERTVLYNTDFDIITGGLLDSEYYQGLDQAGKIKALATESNKMDLRRVTPRVHALMLLFNAGGEDKPIAEFNEMYRRTSGQDLVDSMLKYTAAARREHIWDFQEIVARNGFHGVGDALAQVTYTDMTPVFPLVIRVHTLNIIREAAGMETLGLSGAALGWNRQEMRDTITAMSHGELSAFYRRLNDGLLKIKESNEGDKLVTRYALLEQLDALFTEDVFDGTSVRDKGDIWMGNFEGFLEGVFTAVVARAAVKGVSRVMRGASSSVEAANAARAVGAHRVASNIDELVQREQLGVQFGLGGDEAVPAMLPRPGAIDVTELPDGSKRMVEFNERVREELIESTDSITGQALTKSDRTRAINKDIDLLDMADGAVVHGRMSTLDMLENGTGYRMRVVVGDSAEGGYKNIEDAMEEALDIDPHLGKVNIQRVRADGTLEPVFEDADAFARAVTKGDVDSATAGRIVGGDTADETFYLTYDQERFWHFTDKEVLGSNTFQSTGLVPRVLLAPNAKFGDEIYGSFLKAYMGEHSIKKNFEMMFKPYYKLGKEDKAFVASVTEWGEGFAKDHGRAPDISEIYAKYDGITDAQVEGIIAIRQGMDTMHELFNRRLYRDWQALGYQSALPMGDGAKYHGLILDRAGIGSGMVLDPVSGKMVKLTGRELDDLYNGGGRVMELDIAIDAANETGHKATRIILREDAYKVGKLDTKPLDYHHNYSYRFYDDPYYIVKEQSGIAVNGTVRAGAAGRTSEAIRTAGTQAEAERFARRAGRAEDERSRGVTFRVVRASDIAQSESTLFQKQSIHREGRMFWDERNYDRLPDVNGNRAKLEDPTKALERGLGMAARQLTHEDTLKSIKGAWRADYGHLFKNEAQLLDSFDLEVLSNRLRRMAQNEVNKELKTQMQQGRELLDYMRLIEGTESMMIPKLREAALSVATAINRVTGAKSARLEKGAMTLDPLRTMRSAAFKAFLVLRPFRQAFLQSSQIGYLMPLKPTYVASRQFFKDAIAIRRGVTALRKSGYEDGWSVKTMAKSMKLTEKEYRLLVKEFDRSGLLDLVDVHSFAGGTQQFRKVADDGMMGTIGYRTRQFSKAVMQKFQDVGFNFGEKNNLTFTWNLAVRRALDDKGAKSILEFTRSDWEKLRVDASNLALGMVRPNNFAYQSGILSVGTQFLSFQHKAALGLIGANPAIKGGDQLRVLFGTYLLYGANMYGARDMADQWLVDMGVSDRQIGDTGISLTDLISAGIIENTFNAIGNLTIEDWKNLDAGFATPGIDLNRLIDMQFDTLMSQPIKAAFGAFGNIASKTLEGFDMGMRVFNANPDLPAHEKFMFLGDNILKGALPLYNDVVLSYTGYKMNQWYSASGNPLPLTPTLNSALARGVFGVRTREEMQYYNFQNEIWNQKENYDNIVKETSRYFSTLLRFYGDGTMTRDDVHRQLEGVMNLWEDWPEGKRAALAKDIMNFQQNDGLLTTTLQKTIVDAMADKEVDMTRLLPMIDDMTDIPLQKRAELKQVIIDSHESKMYIDDKALEVIKE